jgi:hypothetical protein
MEEPRPPLLEQVVENELQHEQGDEAGDDQNATPLDDPACEFDLHDWGRGLIFVI